MQNKPDVTRRIYSILGLMKESNVVKLFLVESIPGSTIYRTIQRFKRGLPCNGKLANSPSKFGQKTAAKIKKISLKTVLDEPK